MLHITNGDSVTETLRESSLPGEYLPWRDVLHDGPVPGGLTLRQMSDVRARALSDFGWGDYAGMRANFAERDRILESFRNHTEVVLWFEHDLYDQLQLIQLLDWFSRQELGATELNIIQIDSYPGVMPFYGLGMLDATQLKGLFPSRRSVTGEHLGLGKQAWSVFTADDPSAMVELAGKHSSSLPFLAAALRRFLQEYPWVNDGLSRIERQILKAAAQGAHNKHSIYVETCKGEDVPWGDDSVYLRMARLASGKRPALDHGSANEVAITNEGKALVSGKADWIELTGGIDQWLGGVHLTGSKAIWRWDDKGQKLTHT